MDKDYLAKRLIYLTGRSDPHRINSVFERVLSELDNYINGNIPYEFNSLKKDIAIRNWMAQSDKETVQLIKLWILFKEEHNINIFKNQKEILNFLPNSNKVFWLYECLLKNRIPTINKILKELSTYPELIAILILVYHKHSYKRLRDLIGEITDTFSKVPKKGASALKLFLRHSGKGSFSYKEFLSLKPDLACSILHLYSPMNNRYAAEINSPIKLIGREILKKYESNRKCWNFTPEKKIDLALIDEAIHNYENCDQIELHKYLNNISWSKEKLILSAIFNSISSKFARKNYIISYFKKCSKERKIQFIRWLYRNKTEDYTSSVLYLLEDSGKIASGIIYKNANRSIWIDLIKRSHEEYIKLFINNSEGFILHILGIDFKKVLKTLPDINLKIVEKYLNGLPINDSTISKYIFYQKLCKNDLGYKFLNEQDDSIRYLINLINKERFYISEDNYFIIIDKIIEKNLKMPKNLIFNSDNSLHSTFKKYFFELIQKRVNSEYFKKQNYFGTKFINQLYSESPRKFWDDILNNKKIVKQLKKGIYEKITIKSFTNSLVNDSTIAKNITDAKTLENCKNYFRRSEFLKDKPGLRSAYELCFETNVRILPLILNILKKSKYSHLQELSGSQFDGLYRTYKLPKKTGGNRIITIPHKYLKYIQKIIYESILINLPLHSAATGFRKGFSIVDNAKNHVEKDIVVNIDIANFFPNTSKDLVWQVINTNLKKRFSKNCIRLISELCCYKGGLPMGAPSSPVISNLVLKPCDVAISKVSEKLNIEYSRYADDLTFSGNGGSINILPFVKEVLAQKGYQLDSKKTNIFRKGRRQCVTGLVVNKKISIARPIRKRIRASVHNACQKKPIFWHDKPMSIDELMGRIAFLHQVHPNEAEIYKNQLQENKLL